MIGAAHIGIIAGATPRAGGGGSPGAGSGLPILSGLLAWFDASDSSTITASDGAVSAWADRSGNGNHATQTTEDEKPTLTTGPNGFGILDCRAVDSTGGNLSFSAVTGKTFIAVIENIGGGGILFGHHSATPFYSDARYFPADIILSATYSNTALRTGSASCRRSGFVVNPTAFGKQTSWHVIVFRTDGTGVEISRFLNDRGSAWKGGAKLAEIAVYDSVLSDPDVITLESHLAQKWGCAHRLPFDHAGYVGPAAPTLPIAAAPRLWLDASDEDYRYTIGSALHELRDLAGSGYVTSRIRSSKSEVPSLLSAEQNGLDVVDFGVTGTHSSLRYSQRIEAKTFVIVLFANSTYDYYGGFLFSDESYYDFHRGSGSNNSAAILNSTYANSRLRTGSATTRRDGSGIDPKTTGLNAGWQIVVFRTDGNTVRANQLFNDRGSGLAGARMAEQIIFDDVLSDPDVEKIEGYLAHKWGIALPSGHPYELAPPT